MQGFGGECPGVYYPRLLRDGWTLVERIVAGPLEAVTVFEKPIARGWILRKLAHEQVGAPPGKGCYWDEHELQGTEPPALRRLPDWEWADLDRRSFTSLPPTASSSRATKARSPSIPANRPAANPSPSRPSRSVASCCVACRVWACSTKRRWTRCLPAALRILPGRHDHPGRHGPTRPRAMAALLFFSRRARRTSRCLRNHPSRLQIPHNPRRLLRASHLRAYALSRVFEIDALTGPECGGRLRLTAAIWSDAAIVRILRPFGLPTDSPVTRPARAPPPRDLEVDLCQVDPRAHAFQGIDPLPSHETF
jgi:hypothetical protein